MVNCKKINYLAPQQALAAANTAHPANTNAPDRKSPALASPHQTEA